MSERGSARRDEGLPSTHKHQGVPEWLVQRLADVGISATGWIEGGQLSFDVLAASPPGVRVRVSAFPVGTRESLVQQTHLGWSYRLPPGYPSPLAAALCRRIAERLESSQVEILALCASQSQQPEWSVALAMDAEPLSRSPYVAYPRVVNIESFAFCPARCTFCTYPALERVGTRMSDALLYKILADLEAIPKTVPFGIQPLGMSEPLAESRLDDILEHAERFLPNAMVEIITTANLLDEKRLRRLLCRRNIRLLRVSLNFVNAAEYEAEIGLSWERTLRNVQHLHEAVEAGAARFQVVLNRVRTHDERDDTFELFVQRHFPLFDPRFADRHGWLGRIPAPQRNLDAMACSQWYQLFITATGKVPLCCQDSHIEHSLGDVTNTPLLEIYNQPALRTRRERLTARGEVETCRGCEFVADGVLLEAEADGRT